MNAVARRGYVYLVCGVTLQAATWAAISLLRTLLKPGTAPLDSVAFQAAILVVCLPVFGGHWAWASRAAARDPAERRTLQRWTYLYGMMAVFLAPLLANVSGLLAAGLAESLGVSGGLGFGVRGEPPDLGALAARNLSAILVLGLLWLYHARLERALARESSATGDLVAVRLAYLLGFSLLAGAVAAYATNGVLRWLMYQIPLGGPVMGPSTWWLATDGARVLVLLPTWAVAWSLARAYAGRDEGAARSVLWPIYLYFAVGVSALVTVANLALILRGAFRAAMALPAQGDLRGPLPVVIIAGLVWAYHAWQLRQTAGSGVDAARSAQVRRAFDYLMATVGLAAAVAGATGLLGVLLRVAMAGAFDPAARERLAWAAAALVAGLPLWAWAWRSAQLRLAAGLGDPQARASTVRRIYQVLWQLVGVALTVSGGVYVVYRLLAVLLGAPPPSDVQRRLADAVALVVVGLPLWWYHARSARQDGAADRQLRLERLAALRPVVLATGDGGFARLVAEGLTRALPGIEVPVVAVEPDAVGDEGEAWDPAVAVAQITSAGLLVGTWDAMVPSGDGGVAPAVAAAVAASPASRVLVPVAAPGVDWAGVSPWTTEQAATQAVAAVLQLAGGERVMPEPPIRLVTVLAWLGGAVVALVLGTWLLMEVLGD